MTLTLPERRELERRVASRRGRAEDARRARCVLLAAAGAPLGRDPGPTRVQ